MTAKEKYVLVDPLGKQEGREIFVRAVETSDFERRLQQLEERGGAGA
jgi:hypothetical protein